MGQKDGLSHGFLLVFYWFFVGFLLVFKKNCFVPLFGKDSLPQLMDVFLKAFLVLRTLGLTILFFSRVLKCS